MMKLATILALAVIVWRMFAGRWPWQPNPAAMARQARMRARNLLGIGEGASKQDIVDAHRKLVAMVHPDRGGRNEDVHDANAARDLLLEELANHSREQT